MKTGRRNTRHRLSGHREAESLRYPCWPHQSPEAPGASPAPAARRGPGWAANAPGRHPRRLWIKKGGTSSLSSSYSCSSKSSSSTGSLWIASVQPWGRCTRHSSNVMETPPDRIIESPGITLKKGCTAFGREALLSVHKLLESFKSGTQTFTRVPLLQYLVRERDIFSVRRPSWKWGSAFSSSGSAWGRGCARPAG